jgi:hypothetical protein
MGKMLQSYLDLARSSERRANWLDSWKNDGVLKVWLHRSPPGMRALHNFRQIVTDDKGKDAIRWFPFTCWEDDDYHRQRRFGEGAEANICPGCKLLEHLEARDDLSDDDLIFKFRAGREVRDIIRVDFEGRGKSKTSFQDDFTPRTEFVIAVIPADKPDAIYLTNEPWIIGSKLRARIVRDVQLDGDEDGNPMVRPLCYTFEKDGDQRGAAAYSVSRYDRAKVTEEIEELWGSEAPDMMPFISGGDPHKLRKAMEDSAEIDLPLDDIFAAAVEQWGAKQADDVSFEPEEIEKDEPPKKRAAEKTTAKKITAKKTKSRGAKPNPTKKVELLECDSCGADWPEDEPHCPGCGVMAEEPPAEEEPPRGRARGERKRVSF